MNHNTLAPISKTFDPVKTPSFETQLDQQSISKHRAWIAVKIEALLSHYWTATYDPAVKAEMIKDWVKAMKDFSGDEINKACAEYLATSSKKPVPEKLRAIMIRDRQRLRKIAADKAPLKDEGSKPEPISAERRAEIMNEMGLGSQFIRPKKIGESDE